MDGAFSGVTDAIDEFSYYVPPAQMAAYKKFVDVEDNGLGLIVTKRFGYAYVVAPVEGSPAEIRPGSSAGDFIEKIDGAADAEDGRLADARGAQPAAAGEAADPARRRDASRRDHHQAGDVPSRHGAQRHDLRHRLREDPVVREGHGAQFRAALEPSAEAARAS
jgi:hypothetical protein